MSFTRKRAILACDFCRHRKRRCDGERPCSTCRESNSECHYQDLQTDRLTAEALTAEGINERLGRIETLLEEQNRRMGDWIGGSGKGKNVEHPSPYDEGHAASQYAGGSSHLATPSMHVSALPSGEASADHEQFLIPLDHTTAPNTLLSLPLVQYIFHSIDVQRAAAVPGPSGPGGPRRGRGRGRGRGARSGSGSRSASVSTRGGGRGQRPSPTPLTPRFRYPRNYFFEMEKAQPLPPGLDLVAQHHEHQGPSLLGPGALWPPAVVLEAIHSEPLLLGRLAENYFQLVHPAAPLFRRSEFVHWSALAVQALQTGVLYGETIDIAICLCVWALGCLAPRQGSRAAAAAAAAAGSTTMADRDRLAQALFQPALCIIMHHAMWALGPPTSQKTCQALLLGAAYFSHMGRPLHNARLAYMGSRFFLQTFNECKQGGLVTDERMIRVFWVCFMLETDRAAEFATIRSGVEPLADFMSLPSCLDAGEMDVMIAFAAETSVRRLLNRIHSLLYVDESEAAEGRDAGGGSSSDGGGIGPDPVGGVSGLRQMLPISTELNRQLEAWHKSIPEHLQPPLEGEDEDEDGDGEEDEGVAQRDAMDANDDVDNDSDDDDDSGDDDDDDDDDGAAAVLRERARVLRLRYYEARHLIHRPFFLGVAWRQQQQQQSGQSGQSGPSRPQQPLPPAVLDQCVVCVDSCVAFLGHVLPLLRRRSPYLWSLCQSCLACLVVVVVAGTCPAIVAAADAQRKNKRKSGPGGQHATYDRQQHTRRLRDRVAVRLRQWAVPGSSLEAELRIVDSLPV